MMLKIKGLNQALFSTVSKVKLVQISHSVIQHVPVFLKKLSFESRSVTLKVEIHRRRKKQA